LTRAERLARSTLTISRSFDTSPYRAAPRVAYDVITKIHSK
jgi:hypothetical protein